jgi:micrococcal nuclease
MAILLLLASAAAVAKEGDRLRAIVSRVYDGDTVTVLIYQGPGDWSRQERIRMLDVWAPELRGDTYAEAKKLADWLRGILLGREVVVIDSGTRSGDRMVGTIHLNGTNVNELVMTQIGKLNKEG